MTQTKVIGPGQVKLLTWLAVCVWCVQWCRFVDCQGFDTPTITLRQGALRGIREYIENSQRAVYAYKGIPYAEAPVGRLRFRPPVEHNGWNTTQLFDRYSDSCPQLNTQGYPSNAISEDCLKLNIWIPEVPVTYRKYPVLVFFDGQLFWRQRAAKFPMRDLAAEQIVIVSVNYRTNIFGFLTLGTAEAPGNLGLRDQQMALRWVRRNIAAFGGDRRQITLMGFSAGAASVGYHLLSPSSQGLFQRAIMISGSPLAPWAHISASDSAAVVDNLSGIMGCRNPDSRVVLRCLQNQNFIRLLTASQRLLESRSRFFPIFAPVTDTFLTRSSQMVPEDPAEMLRQGNYAKVPTLMGLSHDDGLLMLYQYPGTDRLTYANLTSVMKRVVGPRILKQYGFEENSTLLKRVLKYQYIDPVPAGNQELMLTNFVKIFSDAYFIAPMYQFAEDYSRAGSVVYAYGFTNRGPDIFGNVANFQGAGHGSELLYLLGPAMFRILVGNVYGLPQRRLGEQLRQHWTSFVLDGDPSRSGAEQHWERFTENRPTFLNLASGLLQNGYRREDARFWNTFLPFISKGATTEPPQTTTDAATQALVDSSQPYQAIMWVLLAIILLLLVGLLLALTFRRHFRQAHSDLSYH